MKHTIYRIFQVFYALVKHVLGISQKRIPNYLRLLLIIFTLIIVILSGIAFVGCLLFYISLRTYIMCKEGNRFAGMMTSQDPFMAPITIHVLCAIKTDTSESYQEDLDTYVRSLWESCNKLRYLIRSFFGYYYYVKSNLKIEDHICKVESLNPGCWRQSSLLDYIQNNIAKESHLKDKSWMITEFQQPIEWLDGSHKYVFVLSVNHAVADGFGLLSLLKSRFNSSDKFEFLNLSTDTNSDKIMTNSLDETYLLLSNPNKNVQQQNHRPLLTFFVETESKFLPLIKNLKQKLRVGFTQILVSGFVVALTEYKAKKNVHNSKLKVTCTFRPFDTKAINMYKGNYNFNNIDNNVFFGLAFLDNAISRNMLSTVLNINRLSNEYMKSIYLVFNKVLITVGHLLPPPLGRALFLRQWYDSYVFISNVTGIGTVAFNKLELENILFFISPGDNADLSVLVLTYENKIHLSVQSAMGIVDNRDDLNGIIQRAFEHISSLANE